jgi:hypothetical protein
MPRRSRGPVPVSGGDAHTTGIKCGTQCPRNGRGHVRRRLRHGRYRPRATQKEVVGDKAAVLRHPVRCQREYAEGVRPGLPGRDIRLCYPTLCNIRNLAGRSEEMYRESGQAGHEKRPLGDGGGGSAKEEDMEEVEWGGEVAAHGGTCCRAMGHAPPQFHTAGIRVVATGSGRSVSHRNGDRRVEMLKRLHHRGISKGAAASMTARAHAAGTSAF